MSAGGRRSVVRFALGGLLVAALVGALAPGAHALTLRGSVSEVVDGDTIKVVSRGFETTVRLIGIETPETRHPSTPVQCFGPAASVRLKPAPAERQGGDLGHRSEPGHP